MDSAVSSSLASGLSSLSADVFSQFALVIPIGIGIVVALAVVFASVRWFMQLSGIGALTWEIWRYSAKGAMGSKASKMTASDLRSIRGY